MKIWQGYGSEHSMNLVLIGKFKEAIEAERTKLLVEMISEQAGKENAYDISRAPDEDQRFSQPMLGILQANKVYSLAPAELEQFVSDHHIVIDKKELKITTDEADVSGFIKILIDAGARVELYSAHDYPDEESED